MTTINQVLTTKGFNLFNINEVKQPVDKNNKALKSWNKLTHQELTNQHDYSSLLWGMRMGVQANQRLIMCLDFKY